MATHKFLVFSSPVEGREDEYNDWYTNVHLKEVCQLPSVSSAQRFELSANMRGSEFAWRYLAIYEIDNDDPAAVMAELAKGRHNMQMSTAIDLSNAGGGVFSPISDVVTG